MSLSRRAELINTCRKGVRLTDKSAPVHNGIAVHEILQDLAPENCACLSSHRAEITRTSLECWLLLRVASWTPHSEEQHAVPHSHVSGCDSGGWGLMSLF